MQQGIQSAQTLNLVMTFKIYNCTFIRYYYDFCFAFDKFNNSYFIRLFCQPIKQYFKNFVKLNGIILNS